VDKQALRVVLEQHKLDRLLNRLIGGLLCEGSSAIRWCRTKRSQEHEGASFCRVIAIDHTHAMSEILSCKIKTSTAVCLRPRRIALARRYSRLSVRSDATSPSKNERERNARLLKPLVKRDLATTTHDTIISADECRERYPLSPSHALSL
jgi:hypothetical protein